METIFDIVFTVLSLLIVIIMHDFYKVIKYKKENKLVFKVIKLLEKVVLPDSKREKFEALDHINFIVDVKMMELSVVGIVLTIFRSTDEIMIDNVSIDRNKIPRYRSKYLDFLVNNIYEIYGKRDEMIEKFKKDQTKKELKETQFYNTKRKLDKLV